MKKIISTMLCAAAVLSHAVCLRAESLPGGDGQLPLSVFVGGQDQHVQGIAYDAEKNCMYMSFTSRFVKVDMQGNVLASIDRIQGHLGAMTFDPRGRKVYASLECKDDEIGQGIAKVLNVKAVSNADSKFYIAVIDVDKLEGMGADPEREELLKTVCVKKAVEDYAGDHRYGCSGIDGVTIAPALGKKGGRMYLYVAYGIYGDVSRDDNDYQIIQRYDLNELRKFARPMVFGRIHGSGPSRPEKEYFVLTGNTEYGVQNLAWDPYTNCMFLAVYKGSKKNFPNYNLFAVDFGSKPFRAPLLNGPDAKARLQLRLVEPGENVCPQVDQATGVTGWRFKYGSMGLCPVGDGLWYISENGKDKQTGKHSCTARLYRWRGKDDSPFTRVF